MDTLIVVVFENEAAARVGAGAVKALHANGAVTLFARAIVTRDVVLGGVIVREPLSDGEASIAPAVGAFIGALVSLLGGPVTAVARSIDAAIVGAVRDLTDSGLDGGFLERVSRHLRPGSAAIVADVQEESPVRLESAVSELVGRVLRHGPTVAAPEDLVLRDIKSLRRGLQILTKERSGSDHFDTARAVQRGHEAALRESLQRAEVLAASLRREAEARAMVMRTQAATLDLPARRTVEKRAEAVRVDYEARASRLDQLIEKYAWHAQRTRARGARRSLQQKK